MPSGLFCDPPIDSKFKHFFQKFYLDLKETIEQTNELNEVDDDGSVQGSRGLQSGSGDSIFGTDHEDKVRMQLPLDWVEERFRVDRRKLEEMILGESPFFLSTVNCYDS